MPVQRHIHAALERQRAEKGYVRALLLKGRQQGGSTYMERVNYNRTNTTPGRSASSLRMRTKKPSNLFEMELGYPIKQGGHENRQPNGNQRDCERQKEVRT